MNHFKASVGIKLNQCSSLLLDSLLIQYLDKIYTTSMKKLCFDWMTWGGMPSEVRLENFYDMGGEK